MLPVNMLPGDRIIYVTHDAGWKVEWKGIFDVFLDKKFALKFAFELRDKLDIGAVLQIKVEGANGIMEIVWTYDKDKFSPGKT